MVDVQKVRELERLYPVRNISKKLQKIKAKCRQYTQPQTYVVRSRRKKQKLKPMKKWNNSILKGT